MALLRPMLGPKSAPTRLLGGVWGALGLSWGHLGAKTVFRPPMGKLRNGFWGLLGPQVGTMLGPRWPPDAVRISHQTRLEIMFNFDTNLHAKMAPKRPQNWSLRVPKRLLEESCSSHLRFLKKKTSQNYGRIVQKSPSRPA